MKHISRTGHVDYDDYDYEDIEKNKAYRKDRWKWERFHLIRAVASGFVGMAIAALIVKGVWELIMLIGKMLEG